MSDQGRRPLRLALVCPPISGHLNPALSLAGELQRRGHRVAWFGVPDGEARVRAAGMEPRVIAADALPLGSVPAHMKRQGELRGLAALRWILRCLQQEALAHFRELPRAWTAWKAEGVLADQVSHGASSAAQGMGLPYVSLCHALPVHADTSVPPFSTTWSHRLGRWGRLRNGLGLSALAPFLKSYLAPLNAARRMGGSRSAHPMGHG
jgi:UDP:flavonoid glycosyltransferase YjiC (YdhE family)